MLCFGPLDEELLVRIAERVRTLIGKVSITRAKGLLQFTGGFVLGLSSPKDPDRRVIYSREGAGLYEAGSLGRDTIPVSLDHAAKSS